MKDWIYKLISASNEVSHKRVLTIFFSLNIICFCYIDIYSVYELPIAMFDSICLLIAGGMGATVLEKFTKKENNINNSKTEENG